MPDTDLQQLLNNLTDNVEAEATTGLKNMAEQMLKTVRGRERAAARENDGLPKQYCHDTDDSVLLLPDKKSCENAGHIWEDNRNAFEKIKDGFDAAKDAGPNYLEAAQEKMKKKVQSITKEANPRLHVATKTTYIDIPYGIFREACADRKEFMEIPYSQLNNNFRFPKKIWTKDKPQTYTPDANMFIGPTKVSLIRAVSSGLPQPADAKDQVAVFTMGIKKVEEALVDLNGKIVPGLKISFYNMPGTESVFPVDDYGKYIPLPLAEDKYDDQVIQLGRYADPASPGVDFLTNFHQAWRYEIVNGLHIDGLKLSSKVLEVINQEVFSREFFCCIFFEIMAANPDLKDIIGDDPGLDPGDISNIKIKILENKIKKIKEDNPNWETDPEDQAKIAEYEDKIIYWENTEYSIQDLLNEQKGWLTALRNILEILLGLMTHKSFGFGWPALGINILEILINSVYMVLMIVIDEVQEHCMEECRRLIAEKKEEFEAKVKEELEKNGTCSDDQYVNKKSCEENGGIWEPGSSLEAALIQCLPWEQILMVMVDAIFGDDGLFDDLRGFIERMRASLMLKTKNMAAEGGQFDSEAYAENKYVKIIQGAIDIINWLLALNADALQVCNMYSRNLSALGDGYDQLATDDEAAGGINTGGRTMVSGEGSNLPDGSSGFQEGHPSTGDSNINLSGRMYSDQGTTTKIDITGSVVDPIGLLVYQTDEDIQKFFIQYMGLTSAEAQEAISGSKKGECMKKLSDEEAAQLKTVLNNAGMEV